MWRQKTRGPPTLKTAVLLFFNINSCRRRTSFLCLILKTLSERFLETKTQLGTPSWRRHLSFLITITITHRMICQSPCTRRTMVIARHYHRCREVIICCVVIVDIDVRRDHPRSPLHLALAEAHTSDQTERKSGTEKL